MTDLLLTQITFFSPALSLHPPRSKTTVLCVLEESQRERHFQWQILCKGEWARGLPAGSQTVRGSALMSPSSVTCGRLLCAAGGTAGRLGWLLKVRLQDLSSRLHHPAHACLCYLSNATAGELTAAPGSRGHCGADRRATSTSLLTFQLSVCLREIFQFKNILKSYEQIIQFFKGLRVSTQRNTETTEVTLTFGWFAATLTRRLSLADANHCPSQQWGVKYTTALF